MLFALDALGTERSSVGSALAAVDALRTGCSRNRTSLRWQRGILLKSDLAGVQAAKVRQNTAEYAPWTTYIGTSMQNGLTSHSEAGGRCRGQLRGSKYPTFAVSGPKYHLGPETANIGYLRVCLETSNIGDFDYVG